MGTNTDTTTVAAVSRIAYAAALRDDSAAAEERRGRFAAAGQPYCDLCGRALKPGSTCKVAYAQADGRLRDASEEVDEDPNLFETLIGKDCAREIPAHYLLDWVLPLEQRKPDLTGLLAIARDVNEANLREIVEGAQAVAREHAETDIVMDPTGAMITDTVGRLWLEMRVVEGGDTWVGGWYSNDGHVAMTGAEVFAGEDAWTL